MVQKSVSPVAIPHTRITPHIGWPRSPDDPAHMAMTGTWKARVAGVVPPKEWCSRDWCLWLDCLDDTTLDRRRLWNAVRRLRYLAFDLIPKVIAREPWNYRKPPRPDDDLRHLDAELALMLFDLG